MKLLPKEARVVAVCDALGITYTELLMQPNSWVHQYLFYLEGKKKAQITEMEEAKKRK